MKLYSRQGDHLPNLSRIIFFLLINSASFCFQKCSHLDDEIQGHSNCKKSEDAMQFACTYVRTHPCDLLLLFILLNLNFLN